MGLPGNLILNGRYVRIETMSRRGTRPPFGEWPVVRFEAVCTPAPRPLTSGTSYKLLFLPNPTVSGRLSVSQVGSLSGLFWGQSLATVSGRVFAGCLCSAPGHICLESEQVVLWLWLSV